MEISFAQVKDLIQQVGFPIVVALWFLFRTDKRLDGVKDALKDVNDTLEKLVDGHED